MTIINRFLQDILFNNKFKRQMRFISGPRQSGKTTIAKIQLERPTVIIFIITGI